MKRYFVDVVSRARVAGWVEDQAAPSSPVRVEVHVNGDKIAEGDANGFREDLRDAGHGSCAFDLDLRHLALPETVRSIDIVTGDGDVLLTTGYCPVDFWSSIAPDDEMYTGQVHSYLSAGADAVRIIDEHVDETAVVRTMLDFPSGHGRVLRHMMKRFPDAHPTACDINESGVAFCESHFKATPVVSNPEFRITLDGPFDLIWVGSLITHLPEPATRKFMDLMASCLSETGTLFITCHGDYVRDRLTPENYGITQEGVDKILTELAATGYGYADYVSSEGYGISVTKPSWYEELFSGGSALQLDAYAPRRWDDHQDVIVLRRRG